MTPDATRRGRQRHDVGFTMVELMLIVAVIGIASTLALTTTARFVQEQRLRQASLELAAYLQSARARAQREGRICQLTITGTTIGPSSVSGNACATVPSLNLASVSGASGLTIGGASSDPITFTGSGVMASQVLSSSTLIRVLHLGASGTTLQRCVFLDLVSIRVGWRNSGSGVCSYTTG